MCEVQDLECAGCEEKFNRRHGDYVHRVFLCYQCIWKTEIARVRDLEREALKLRELGMSLVTAVEATHFISMRNNKTRLAVALRGLREFLCKR